MYETIVVALDDSAFSKAALMEASNWITRNHSGRIILVHAVYFDEEEFGIAPEQRESRLEQGRKIVREAREATTKLGIPVDSIVREGEPHEVLVDVLQETRADLVAMGTHGRKGLKKLFMGSVTSRVIARSPCDILVTRREPKASSARLGSILLSFDGSRFARKALERASELAKREQAELTVLYVIPHYEEMLEFFPTSVVKQNLMQDAQDTVEGARRLASEHDVSIKTIIEQGDTSDKVSDIAERLGIELVVRGTHGWKGFDKALVGSVAEDILVKVSCPVLVVR